MTNEIKEILDRLNENKDYDDYVDYKGSYFKPLLDYITNLQEKIKNLDLDLDSYKSKYNNIKLHYEELAKENKELQQQKDKAIEYIEKLTTRMNTLNYQISDLTKNNLLNILRGDE